MFCAESRGARTVQTLRATANQSGYTLSIVSEELERCYVAAMRILNYRFNSEAELRRKLAAKKFEAADIDATLARLGDERWLDDQRFAGAFVRTLTRKRIGSRRIVRQLQAAGVSDEVASRAVAENLDPEREREGIEAACRKRIESLRRRHGDEFPASEEGRAKIASWLLARGYEPSLIWESIRSLLPRR